MKSLFAIFLLSCSALYFSACQKTNKIAAVSGTINGTPTITLYGNSGAPTDYVLLSTDPKKVEMAYQGEIFPYSISSPDTIIYITTSTTTVVQATLFKSGNTTILNINPLSPPKFASLHYYTY